MGATAALCCTISEEGTIWVSGYQATGIFGYKGTGWCGFSDRGVINEGRYVYAAQNASTTPQFKLTWVQNDYFFFQDYKHDDALPAKQLSEYKRLVMNKADQEALRSRQRLCCRSHILPELTTFLTTDRLTHTQLWIYLVRVQGAQRAAGNPEKSGPIKTHECSGTKPSGRPGSA